MFFIQVSQKVIISIRYPKTLFIIIPSIIKAPSLQSSDQVVSLTGAFRSWVEGFRVCKIPALRGEVDQDFAGECLDLQQGHGFKVYWMLCIETRQKMSQKTLKPYPQTQAPGKEIIKAPKP